MLNLCSCAVRFAEVLSENRVKTRTKAFFIEEILIKNSSENLPKLSKERMQHFCHALKLNFK